MKKILKIALYTLLVIMVFVCYIFIEPYWIENKTITIINKEVPNSFNNTKIVFITDIHHGPFFNISRVKSLVQRINMLNPDIILLGGDYIHRSPKYIKPCFGELKFLKANVGVYGVLGNHDHWENANLVRKYMAYSGIKLLDNNAYWVWKNNEKIKIGGVGDFLTDYQDLNPTISDVEYKDFVILVTHNPDYSEEIKTKKIDLVFAGHTHGGQMSFFGLWAPLIPSKYGQKYRTGVIKTKFTEVLISNGIGTITPPVRFFARPQILIVILKNR